MTDNDRLQADLSLSQSRSAPHLTYRGGELIAQVQVQAVFWGRNVRFVGLLNQFYTDMTNGPMLDMLREYNTPSYIISRGSMSTGYIWDEAPGDTYLTDSTIQNELNKLIQAGTISATSNTLLMVHFPPGVTVEMPGGGRSCQQFCAYHGVMFVNGQPVHYGIIADHAGNCSTGCGGGRQVPDEFARTTVSASHELVEAVTDPDPPYGWYDDANAEIGDICNQQPVQVGKWWMQKEWSNQRNSCAP